MSREARHDLQLLQKFVDGYRLSGIATEKGYGILLGHLHRRYLALLTIQAELTNQIASSTGHDPLLPQAVQVPLLREAASDVGQVVFCWIHGAYKASRVMLSALTQSAPLSAHFERVKVHHFWTRKSPD